MRGGASLLRKEKEAHRGRSFMEYVPAEKGVKSLLQELLINDMQVVPVTLDNLYSCDDVVREAIFYIGERLADIEPEGPERSLPSCLCKTALPAP